MKYRGRIEKGCFADLLVLKGGLSLFDHNPSDIRCVIREGNFLLVDEPLKKSGAVEGELQPVETASGRKYVEGDLAGLVSEIRHYFPLDNPYLHA
jgi:hypothetical protein